MTGTGRIAVFALMFVPLSEFPIHRFKLTQWFIRLSKHRGPIAVRVWSTFTLRTLVSMFSFLEAVKPCPSANSSFDAWPNEGTLCKSTHTHNCQAHSLTLRGRLESGCIEALMAPFVAMKGNCANFSQASHCQEMYSDSTGDTACSLTLAKTSELLAKKGGQTSIPTPTTSIRRDITPRSPLKHIYKYTGAFWQCQEGIHSTQIRSD